MRKESIAGGLSSFLLAGTLMACSDQSSSPDLKLPPPTPTPHVITARPEPTSTPYINRATPTFAAAHEVSLEKYLTFRLVDNPINITENPKAMRMSMYLIDQGEEADIILESNIKASQYGQSWSTDIIINIGLMNLKKQYPYRYILRNVDGDYYSILEEFDPQKLQYLQKDRPQLLSTDHSANQSMKIRMGNGFLQAGVVDVATKQFKNRMNPTSTFQIGGRVSLTLGQIEEQNADVTMYRYDLMAKAGTVEYKGSYSQ